MVTTEREAEQMAERAMDLDYLRRVWGFDQPVVDLPAGYDPLDDALWDLGDEDAMVALALSADEG